MWSVLLDWAKAIFGARTSNAEQMRVDFVTISDHWEKLSEGLEKRLTEASKEVARLQGEMDRLRLELEQCRERVADGLAKLRKKGA